MTTAIITVAADMEKAEAMVAVMVVATVEAMAAAVAMEGMVVALVEVSTD